MTDTTTEHNEPDRPAGLGCNEGLGVTSSNDGFTIGDCRNALCLTDGSGASVRLTIDGLLAAEQYLRNYVDELDNGTRIGAHMHLIASIVRVACEYSQVSVRTLADNEPALARTLLWRR